MNTMKSVMTTGNQKRKHNNNNQQQLRKTIKDKLHATLCNSVITLIKMWVLGAMQQSGNVTTGDEYRTTNPQGGRGNR